MCKHKYQGVVRLVGPDSQPVEAGATFHPAGCMGARQAHLDITMEGDPCGLAEYLSRRGGIRVRARLLGGCLVVDVSHALGVPCLVEVCPAPTGRGGRVYLMRSRSGTLYLSFP